MALKISWSRFNTRFFFFFWNTSCSVSYLELFPYII